MERIAPAPKDQPVSFSLPEMHNALDASQAAGSVLTAASEGELTPIEATRVMGLIDSYRRTLELTEIEQRLQALKQIRMLCSFHLQMRSPYFYYYQML